MNITSGPSSIARLNVTTADLLRPQTLPKRVSQLLKDLLCRYHDACLVDVALCRGGVLVKEISFGDERAGPSGLLELLPHLGSMQPGDQLCLSVQRDTKRMQEQQQAYLTEREQVAWLALPSVAA